MAATALDDADRAAVEAAVTAAEKRTAARFKLVVAHAADSYGSYPLLWAAASALTIGDIVALAWSALPTAWIVAAQAVVFVIADGLLHLPALRYRTVPPRVLRERAQRLAQLEFAALVHDRTPGDVGLLLFVSQAERHVQILVDDGIDQRVDQTAWDKVVSDFVGAVRGGPIAAALVGATGACAAILERHFPPQAGAPAAPGSVTEL